MNTQALRKLNMALMLAMVIVVGCAFNSTDTVIKRQSNSETIEYGKSRKFVKEGITVVYLTGSPYEIGFTNGKLCKDEIEEANRPFFEKYELLIQNPNNLWLRMSKKLEDHVPEEYIEEMHGIYWI